MKKSLILIFILTIGVIVVAKPYELRTTTSPHTYIYHQHNESSYQHAYQKKYYFSRVQRIGKAYNIQVEYITDDILNLNKFGHCPYKDCKCNKGT